MISLSNIFPVISTATQQKSQSKLNLWQMEDDFPSNGSIVQQLNFLLNYATLSSSSYKTQPWSFEIVDNVIELYINQSRVSPANSDIRELIISCGAAIFHLCIAIRHFGYQDVIEILPEPRNFNLLARICLGSRRIPRIEENFLFRAITKRRTNRLSDNCKIPSSLQTELELAACSEGDWLQITTQIIDERHREVVIKSIAEGDRLQRLELHSCSSSTSHSRSVRNRGLLNRRLNAISPLISRAFRSFDSSKSQTVEDCYPNHKAPLMLICSDDDTPQDWLATGQALAHLLLRAKIDDVWLSFFNQPIQVPQLRSRLQALYPDNGYPQILLRLDRSAENESSRLLEGIWID